MNPSGGKFSAADLDALGRLVAEMAEDELMSRFRRIGHDLKADGSLVTEADLAMQVRLAERLAALHPGIPLLGEEMPATQQQALLDRAGSALWCLDPLDGTSNFAHGIPYFAVSLALLEEGQPLLGVVYDPSRRECFTARRGKGAWLNGEPLSCPPGAGLGNSIAMVDFKRLAPELAARVASQGPYRSQRNFGASALDWCWLAAGRFQIYLHGGQSLWDHAAGSLILDEAGGAASNLHGEEVTQRQEIGRKQSVVAAVDEVLHRDWLDWLVRV